MSLSKKYIINNIKSKAQLSHQNSFDLVNAFLNHIKKDLNQKRRIKISGFGAFSINPSVQRIGRNPKSGKEYLIPIRNISSFKASAKVKSYINS